MAEAGSKTDVTTIHQSINSSVHQSFDSMKYSIIIPVYNRPQEIKELLQSLTTQTYQNFEVLVVEDGSEVKCSTIVQHFNSQLNIKYLDKSNSGPGLSRNYGAEHASGEYLIFLDSDCIIPAHYLEEVQKSLVSNYVDAFGGADKAAPSFNKIQKAINYSMTSFFTTGGIRGGAKRMDKFYPRSFNMGFSIAVYKKTKGFSTMRFGEDIDMSIRIFKSGYKVKFIEKAYVYHKRRTDFKKFYKQVFNSGIARINLSRKYPETLKLVHLLPAAFTIGLGLLLFLSLLLSWFFLLPVLLLMLILLVDSTFKNKDLSIGLLSIPASFIQLIGYGCGFLFAFWNTFVLKKEETGAFKHTFYK